MTPNIDLAYPHRLGMSPHERRIARRVREARYCIVLALAIVLGWGTGAGGLSASRTVVVEMVEVVR